MAHSNEHSDLQEPVSPEQAAGAHANTSDAAGCTGDRVEAAGARRSRERYERIQRREDAANERADDFFEGALDLDIPDGGAQARAVEAQKAGGEHAGTHRHSLHKPRRFPRGLKLFGVVLLITSFAAAAMIVLGVVGLVGVVLRGDAASWGAARTQPMTIACIIISVVRICLYLLIIMESWRLGLRLLHDDHHKVGTSAHALSALYMLTALCDIMLTGLDVDLFANLIIMALLEWLSVYADPALRDERELQRQLGRMELRDQAEKGTLGLDTSGDGYIKLNFFNLFWIFVICCFLGWLIETVYHMAVVDPGVYQERAGLLYGPFSPIYGLGGALLTMALNRFQKKNVIILFLVSAVVGGAFEYFVSWFLQFSFGVTAWDYTGTFLSIDGRTNGQFMAMWGVLGVVWMRLCLPVVLRLVNRIPWNWRYGVTAVCAVLMLADGLLTLSSLDCWYQRQAGTMGQGITTVIDDFCNQHYNDTFMQNRFQSMSMDPSKATRIN